MIHAYLYDYLSVKQLTSLLEIGDKLNKKSARETYSDELTKQSVKHNTTVLVTASSNGPGDGKQEDTLQIKNIQFSFLPMS